MNISNYDPETVALIEAVKEQKSNMSEEVFDTLSRLIEVAREQDDYVLQGFAHYHLADALYSYEKDYNEFRENLAKAIYFFTLGGEKELLARAYNYVSVDALNNSSFDVAYLYLMNALQTCEGLDNNYLLSIINNNIGQVYARMHSFDKAVKFVHRGNELQAMCADDDYYFNQNMISGYFSEGVLYALMDDLQGAKAANEQIAKLEKETDISNMSSVYIPIALLRLMIAVLEENDEEIEIRSRDIIEKIHEGHRVYDYITDLEDLCNFLIDHGYLDTVKEIIDIIKSTVDSTNVVQMKKIISSIEIKYYEKRGDTEKVIEHLRDQYHLSEQQQMEQNRIYQYSIDLINIMEEQRKKQEKVMKENEYLHSQVQTDPLTGIPNRLKLDSSIPELFEKAKKERRHFAVSLMDIDKFKEYNDTYGHLAGDICLQQVAKMIQEVSEKPGVHCARYGGDEFIMLYEDLSDDEIMNIANELNQKIYGLGIEHKSMGSEGRVSVSQGICNCIPEEHYRQEDYLNEADNALYAVKKNMNLPGKSGSIRLTRIS